jgi:hypothetical protein
MSLGIVIKAPEGLVLAAESRLTLTAQSPNQPPIHVNFDNATKLMSFTEPNSAVGIVTYGLAAIGLRTAQSFIPAFEAELASEAGEEGQARLPISEFAEKFSAFFMRQWQAVMPPDYSGPSMTFVVAGFDEDNAYGQVYLIEIPASPTPRVQHQMVEEFGITWGGQREIVDRLLNGYDERLGVFLRNLNISSEESQQLSRVFEELQLPLPLQAMPLQDCVDLAIFFIRTTISAQKLTVGLRGVGGHIDVATITQKDGLRFIQRKQLRGEVGPSMDSHERSRL